MDQESCSLESSDDLTKETSDAAFLSYSFIFVGSR